MSVIFDNETQLYNKSQDNIKTSMTNTINMNNTPRNYSKFLHFS